MKSYFFIPASKLNKLQSVINLGVEEIIIDFEDAILSSEKNKYLGTLVKLNDFKKYWVRIPIRNGFNESVDLDFLTIVYKLGVRKIVLPKLKSKQELINIISKFNKALFIVLIEHPRLLLEVHSLFQDNTVLMSNIQGIGLGSHDLMTVLGASHEFDQLDFPRKEVLYLAKAYNLEAIDIASMNIENDEKFKEELEYAINNGYDSKFLIHPKQYSWMQKLKNINKEAVSWAEKISLNLPEKYTGGSIEPFIIDGNVIEKPHVIKALEILRKEKYGK
jgi:citrate lyase beta subunit